MEIVFLGTGGGRINLIKQIRGTGGFRINSEAGNIHIDPGPGALLASKRYYQDPLKLDCIIVTHSHTDHITDAQVLTEAMEGYALHKKGIFIGSSTSIAYLSAWHKDKIKEIYQVEHGEIRKFETGKGAFEIETYTLKHDEETAFGFKLFLEGKVVGHITDTEYTEELGKQFKGCDILIINCIKPEPDQYKGHLTSEDVTKILKVAKPRLCVITHMGLKLLRLGPAKIAEKITKDSKTRTVAAKDGMKLDL